MFFRTFTLAMSMALTVWYGLMAAGLPLSDHSVISPEGKLALTNLAMFFVALNLPKR